MAFGHSEAFTDDGPFSMSHIYHRSHNFFPPFLHSFVPSLHHLCTTYLHVVQGPMFNIQYDRLCHHFTILRNITVSIFSEAPA